MLKRIVGALLLDLFEMDSTRQLKPGNIGDGHCIEFGCSNYRLDLSARNYLRM